MRTIQNMQAILIIVQLVQALALALLTAEVSRIRHDLDLQAL